MRTVNGFTSWPHVAALLVGILATGAGCGDRQRATPAQAPAVDGARPTADVHQAEHAETPLPPSVLETRLPPGVLGFLLKPFTGDLDGMIERRLVRVGVTFNRTFYFVDNGMPSGVAYEYGQLLEERLNKHFKTRTDNRVYVALLPLPRAHLLPALVGGKLDMVAAQVMVEPELQKLVDFTTPTRKNVSQILVTGPGAGAVSSIEDLSGQTVFVRDMSNSPRKLLALNETLKAQGKPPVVIRTAPDNLEDDDLLEMVNAGLIPAIVVDDYLAIFWKQIFSNITLHRDIAMSSGGTLAVAIRKGSPKLSAALNTFMGNYGLGTAFGNQIERKYLVNTTYAKSATSEAERAKFFALVEFFRKYGKQYDVDYLLMTAQGYQESRLDQDAKSAVGAIGVMQVMPATGKALNVGDIRKTEANIHAGVKYMRVTEDTFFKDEPMDALNKALFTFAAYNAGPARIRQLRKEAENDGLDPNRWFGNVETIAAERIGRETVTYVANIYKYYVAYRLVMEEIERRDAAKAEISASEGK